MCHNKEIGGSNKHRGVEGSGGGLEKIQKLTSGGGGTLFCTLEYTVTFTNDLKMKFLSMQIDLAMML